MPVDAAPNHEPPPSLPPLRRMQVDFAGGVIRADVLADGSMMVQARVGAGAALRFGVAFIASDEAIACDPRRCVERINRQLRPLPTQPARRAAMLAAIASAFWPAPEAEPQPMGGAA